MNNPLLVVEAARWNKIGRRWSILLGVLLTVNLSLVVVAVRGYVVGQPPEPSLAAGPEGSDVTATSLATANALPSETGAESGETGTTTGGLDQIVNSGETATPGGTAPIDGQPTNATAANPTDKTPVAPVETSGPPTPTERSAELIILNPHETGGAVHFLVDDQFVSLEAGEYRRISTDTSRRVVYHKGDEFENVALSLEAGVFTFSVTAEGWQLDPAGSEADVMLALGREVADQ